MQTMTCPHCNKTIELVEPKDLKEQYGMSPNTVVHARKLGVFPDPILQFENRTIWLKSAINDYVQEKNNKRIESLVSDFEQLIARLPKDEQEQARKLIATK